MARVLVAEDNRLMRWSLETSLAREGHIVHSVDSGKAAIDTITTEDGHFDIVVTDYGLPCVDGLTVLWQTKFRHPGTHVILITSQATPKLERMARDVGAFGFMEKPLQFLTLKRVIDHALATPERRRGPRGCCGECLWARPCERWETLQTSVVH
jgi:DNA-binding NtrC family response regulator